MKIGEVIDLVLQEAGGGSLNVESAVWDVDVYAYLPTAINAAVMQDKEAKDANKRTNTRAGMLSVSSASSNIFYIPYTISPTKGDDGLYYADLPGILIGALANGGVDSIYPTNNPQMTYHRAHTLASIAGLGHVLAGPWWWTESNEQATRLRFIGLDSTAPLVVRAALLPTLMDRDVEAPIPTGAEMAVIEACKKHFFGVRTKPADAEINQQDININAQAQQNS